MKFICLDFLLFCSSLRFRKSNLSLYETSYRFRFLNLKFKKRIHFLFMLSHLSISICCHGSQIRLPNSNLEYTNALYKFNITSSLLKSLQRCFSRPNADAALLSILSTCSLNLNFEVKYTPKSFIDSHLKSLISSRK